MDAQRSGEGVTVRLSHDEALVLSDLLHRWEETNSLNELSIFEDKAERVVLWDLCASFDPTIDEVFRDDYSARLSQARRAILGGDLNV